MIVNESFLSLASRKQFNISFSVGFYMFWDTRDSHEMRLRTERFSLHPCLGLITIYCLESLFLWMFNRFVMKLSKHLIFKRNKRTFQFKRTQKKKIFDLNLLLISLSSVPILEDGVSARDLFGKLYFRAVKEQALEK